MSKKITSNADKIMEMIAKYEEETRNTTRDEDQPFANQPDSFVSTPGSMHTGPGAKSSRRKPKKTPNTAYKDFDTSTLQGSKASERYQSRLYGLYDKVEVMPIGLYRVRIIGRNPI